MTDSSSLVEVQYQQGYRILGPVFAQYLARLHQYINSFEEQHDAKILFAARAGVRIQRLYEAFAKARGSATATSSDFFWVSRFMAVKGLWNRIPEAGCKLLTKEFNAATCGDILRALYRVEGGLPSDIRADDPALTRPAAEFRAMMLSDSEAARVVGSYLAQQADLFESYFAGLVQDRKCVVLVDSGWQGTTQLLMQSAFPELEWWGLYWGRSFLAKADTRSAHKMVGLMFESDAFIPHVPNSAIVLHRHLIEGILEPNAPSIERFAMASEGPVAPEAEALLQERVQKATSPLFCGVLDYIKQLPDGSGYGAIADAYQRVAPELSRILAFPTREEALTFGTFERSADFGRTLKVPVLVDKSEDEKQTAEDRIASALWTSGQIALEYPPQLKEARQRQGLGLRLTARALYDAAKSPSQRKGALAVPGPTNRPAVAVIMRTMDRPVLLERAIGSVARQTFSDYVLVIVCDGGPIDAVTAAVEQSPIDQRKVIVVDNVVNRGMEAASNIAIAACDSEFIVIHDDDDSWQPDFLQKTVTFLRGKAGQKYGGVITHSWYLSEQVTPDGIIQCDRRGYQDWVENVQFMELCCGNFFPPIAFLFRRAVYDAIGKFDERLPVLGDWDFNLRFVLNSDIGVIKEKLANYHHRDVGNTMYPNSVIGDLDKHAEFSAIMRNKYLRMHEMSHEGSPGKAFVSMAHVITDIRNTVRALDAKVANTRPASASDTRIARAQAMADDRWVALHYIAATGPADHAGDLGWRADCHWVELHHRTQ